MRSICSALVALLALSTIAIGQGRESVLYSFGANQNDGNTPNGDLLFDAGGNIYGTTPYGGAYNGGIVFELSPAGNGNWTETILHDFCLSQYNCMDGANPSGGLVVDSVGNFYGLTMRGGTYGSGTFFELSPPTKPGTAWTETVFWNFGSNHYVETPIGTLVWGPGGSLFGATEEGGAGLGSVFELTLNQGGGWSESDLYAFCRNGPPCSDGAEPMAGVTFDQAGNLYGTTEAGGFKSQWGVVYQLKPVDGGWTETTLHTFSPVGGGGGHPLCQVSIDPSGNLYGTVYEGGRNSGQCGGVWKLAPQTGGTFKAESLPFNCSDPFGPSAPAAGVLLDPKTKGAFGTSYGGGEFGYGGTLYRILGNKSTVVYSFCQQTNCTDGAGPTTPLTAHGSALYGTTSEGGAFNKGIVFSVAP